MPVKIKIMVVSVCCILLAASTPRLSHAQIKIIKVTQPCQARSVVIDGEKAYLLGFWSNLSVWDISDFSNIHEIGRYDEARDRMWQAKTINMKYNTYGGEDGGIGQCRGGMAMAKSDRMVLALIPTGHHGLQAVDVTDPKNIFNRGRAPYPDNLSDGMSCSVRAKSGYIFMGGEFGGFNVFQIADFLDGGDPYQLIAEYRREVGTEFGVKGIAVSKNGNYLYLARKNGLEICGITFPFAPEFVSFSKDIQYPYKEPNYGRSVAEEGDYIIFGTDRDLRFFDVKNPFLPKILKNASGKVVIYPTLGAVIAIQTFKNYAFLFYGPSKRPEEKESGLEIVDISDPADPQFVDALPLAEIGGSGMAQDIALSPEKGIIIIPADSFYFLDVREYLK